MDGNTQRSIGAPVGVGMCSRNPCNRLGRAALAGLFALGIVTGAGCSSTPNDREVNAFIHDWEANVSAAEYRVQPPDSIEISSPQSPEVDGEIQTIRQDGKISLRLLGDVQVAGLTPAEIARKLESLLATYYESPQVNVRLADAMSKKYYVFGQVEQPGAFPYSGRDTLITALAKARLRFIAARDKITVIRPSQHEDKRSVVCVNAKRMIEDGKMDQNLLLQEGDIIYVPPTPLGRLGLAIAELTFPLGQASQSVMVSGGGMGAGRVVSSAAP